MNLRNRIEALLRDGGDYTTEELCAGLGEFFESGDLPQRGRLGQEVLTLVRQLIQIAGMDAAPQIVPGNDYHNGLHRALAPWRATTARILALLEDVEQDDAPGARAELRSIIAAGWTRHPLSAVGGAA